MIDVDVPSGWSSDVPGEGEEPCVLARTHVVSLIGSDSGHREFAIAKGKERGHHAALQVRLDAVDAFEPVRHQVDVNVFAIVRTSSQRQMSRIEPIGIGRARGEKRHRLEGLG